MWTKERRIVWDKGGYYVKTFGKIYKEIKKGIFKNGTRDGSTTSWEFVVKSLELHFTKTYNKEKVTKYITLYLG